VELALATFLHVLVPEHRPHVPQTLRTVVSQAVLNHGTHATCGTFRPQGQLVIVEFIGPGVHLLFHDIGMLSNAAHEKIRRFDNRHPDVAIAVLRQYASRSIFKQLPERRVLGQDVVETLDALELDALELGGLRFGALQFCAL